MTKLQLHVVTLSCFGSASSWVPTCTWPTSIWFKLLQTLLLNPKSRTYRMPEYLSPMASLGPKALAQPTTPSAFESLPFEIREQIWLETLTPRLIYLHPHERLSPPHNDLEHDKTIDGQRSGLSVRFNYSVHHPSNTRRSFLCLCRLRTSWSPSTSRGKYSRAELQPYPVCTRSNLQRCEPTTSALRLPGEQSYCAEEGIRIGIQGRGSPAGRRRQEILAEA